MLNLGAMGINRVASDCLSIVGRSHMRLKGMLEFLLPFLSCSAERSFAFPGAFIIGGPIAIWFQPHRWFKGPPSPGPALAMRAQCFSKDAARPAAGQLDALSYLDQARCKSASALAHLATSSYVGLRINTLKVVGPHAASQCAPEAARSPPGE
jgi:hypothetical protein